MKCCTFFGHHDCPDSIKGELQDAIKRKIEEGVNLFYIGNHGRFDAMALSCLRELIKEYPEISYAVVLAYLPTERNGYTDRETVFPEGIESIPRRFAIDYRNRWMIDRADVVIAHVTHAWGGAAKYVRYAERKVKRIVYLKEKIVNSQRTITTE
ncbi:MAG: DUF1273 family protein [Clostridia bacterium]|nr:DUF1273 family protein [Clostridia bacterium]